MQKDFQHGLAEEVPFFQVGLIFDGGGIMVDWVGLDLEDLDGLQDQAGVQAGAIGLEEPVQSPAQGVIAPMLSGTPERSASLRPGFDAAEGAGLEQNALDQKVQRGHRRRMRDGPRQRLAPAHSLEKGPDHRQSPLNFFAQRQGLSLQENNPNVQIH
jgi:hypothetical protein